tara:strand:- start:218 stop:367 length:150 start_codon:yes stop_codon:yes gene_type:complete
MDEDLQRIKSLKCARSYKEATGQNFKAEDKSNKFPWIVFAVCILILLVL